MGESRGFREKHDFSYEQRQKAAEFLRDYYQGPSQSGSDLNSDFSEFCKSIGIVSRSEMDDLFEQAQVTLLAEIEAADQERPDSIFAQDPEGARDLMLERVRQLRNDH